MHNSNSNHLNCGSKFGLFLQLNVFAKTGKSHEENYPAATCPRFYRALLCVPTLKFYQNILFLLFLSGIFSNTMTSFPRNPYAPRDGKATISSLLTVACTDLYATKRLSMFRSGHFLTSALLLIHFHIQFWSYAAKAGKSSQ